MVFGVVKYRKCLIIACLLVTLLISGNVSPVLAADSATAETNLLVNPGFESGESNGFPVGWHARGANSDWVKLSEAEVYAGQWSVGLFTPGDRTSGWGIQSESIPVVVGKTYEATGMVKLFGSRVQIYIEFYNSAGSRIIPHVGAMTANNEWRLLSISGEAPEGATTARVLLYMPPNVPNTYAYFDDIVFKERVEVQVTTEDINRKAGTFYVSPDGHDRNPGTADAPWATLEYASARAIAGDTVMFLPGEYEGVLKPARSGTSDAPITFKALERRTARLVGEPGATYAVQLSRVEHVHLDGFHIKPRSDQGRWMTIDNSKHIRIDDVLMEDAKGGLPFLLTHSDHVQMRDSVMRGLTGSGHNMARVSNSDYLLFEGNSISRAGHSPFQFYPDGSSRYVVVRGNVFHAAWGRNFEFFGTRDILFEHNIVTNAFDSGRSTSSNAKFATDRGIFRFNRVFRNWGGPIHLYPFRDVWIQNTRLYNNVFDDNVDYGIGVSGASQMKDVLFVNNVFSRNDGDGVGTQINVVERNPEFVRFESNVIAADHPSGAGPINYGGLLASVDVVQGAGAAAGLRRLDRGQFANNLDVLPDFVDPGIYNHALKQSSDLLDSGQPLTRTVGAGNGRKIPVEDAAYFYDGFGIEGEVGDLIAIGSTDQRARIVNVDYNVHVITVDADVRWEDGAVISFPWSGSGPDIGVYEHGVTGRPTVQVLASPFLVRPGEDVRLTAAVLGISEEPVEIRWQLGDGTLAFGPELIHRYEQSYDYPLRVRVTMASGDVLRGTGYVVVERQKEIDEPFLHSTFDSDDQDWWWHWKPYTPVPTEYAHELDHTTGNGVLRLTNPGGGEIPLRVAPAQWDINLYPWVYVRYKVSPGAPIGLFFDAFRGVDVGSNKVWIASTQAGRKDPAGRSARYDLVADGEWHTLLIDARTIRLKRPDAQSLRRMGLWALGATEKGDTYWLDEVAILPEAALNLPEWEEKLKYRQRGHVNIVSPQDGATINGKISLNLALENYDADVGASTSTNMTEIMAVLNHMIVTVDDETILTTDDLRDMEVIRIQTMDFADGQRRLAVIVTDDEGATLQRSVTMSVRNRQLLKDRLLPPELWSFFGETMITDHSMTVDESDGWAYTDQLEASDYKDVTGKVKTTADREYLTWEAPDLKAFEIVVYTTMKDPAAIVKTTISTDSEEWVELPFTVKREGTVRISGKSWNKFVLQGDGPKQVDHALFRLEVGSDVAALQFGVEEVTIDIRSF